MHFALTLIIFITATSFSMASETKKREKLTLPAEKLEKSSRDSLPLMEGLNNKDKAAEPPKADLLNDAETALVTETPTPSPIQGLEPAAEKTEKPLLIDALPPPDKGLTPEPPKKTEPAIQLQMPKPAAKPAIQMQTPKPSKKVNVFSGKDGDLKSTIVNKSETRSLIYDQTGEKEFLDKVVVKNGEKPHQVFNMQGDRKAQINKGAGDTMNAFTEKGDLDGTFKTDGSDPFSSPADGEGAFDDPAKRKAVYMQN